MIFGHPAPQRRCCNRTHQGKLPVSYIFQGVTSKNTIGAPFSIRLARNTCWAAAIWLFKPSGGRPIRLHGPFLADEECAAVVNHWKNQLEPDYKVDFTKWAGENSAQQGRRSRCNKGSHLRRGPQICNQPRAGPRFHLFRGNSALSFNRAGQNHEPV